jgi:hypothetical protein
MAGIARRPLEAPDPHHVERVVLAAPGADREARGDAVNDLEAASDGGDTALAADEPAARDLPAELGDGVAHVAVGLPAFKLAFGGRMKLNLHPGDVARAGERVVHDAGESNLVRVR